MSRNFRGLGHKPNFLLVQFVLVQVQCGPPLKRSALPTRGSQNVLHCHHVAPCPFPSTEFLPCLPASGLPDHTFAIVSHVLWDKAQTKQCIWDFLRVVDSYTPVIEWDLLKSEDAVCCGMYVCSPWGQTWDLSVRVPERFDPTAYKWGARPAMAGAWPGASLWWPVCERCRLSAIMPPGNSSPQIGAALSVYFGTLTVLCPEPWAVGPVLSVGHRWLS